MLLQVAAALGPKLGQVADCEHVLESKALDLLSLAVVLAEDSDGLGMLDDVSTVARRRVGVDRGTDRADEGEREVEERPFEPGRCQDRERVPLAHAERQQAVRKLVDGERRLLTRHGLPAVGGLREVGGRLPATRDGVLPQSRDRPVRRYPRCRLDRHAARIVGGRDPALRGEFAWSL